MVIKNIMYVLSVIRKEKQQECYMHITSIHGRSFLIKDIQFHRKYKFEALDKPNLLLEYLGDNKAVKDYINE